MGVYIGVNNIAKKVSSLYIGINNIARKVKGGYVGVNNIAHSFLTSGPDVTKTEYTEAEINELAAYGLINKIPIDSKVTIGNTRDNNRTIHTYRVIGKDHQDLNIENYGSSGSVEEGTAPAIGTVDLWATGAVWSDVFNIETPHGKYTNSHVYTWLNSDYYYGFSDVTKTHMKTMVVEYYFTTTNGNSITMKAKGNYKLKHKVKLLSAKEFNPSSFDAYMHQREGNGYEYFPSVPYTERNTVNAKKRYASETGTANVDRQWYRSLNCQSFYSGNAPYRANQDGSIAGLYSGDSSLGVVPCFRLGA